MADGSQGDHWAQPLNVHLSASAACFNGPRVATRCFDCVGCMCFTRFSRCHPAESPLPACRSNSLWFGNPRSDPWIPLLCIALSGVAQTDLSFQHIVGACPSWNNLNSWNNKFNLHWLPFIKHYFRQLSPNLYPTPNHWHIPSLVSIWSYLIMFSAKNTVT